MTKSHLIKVYREAARKVRRKFMCFIGDHDWTCDAMEGIPPKLEHLNPPGMAGFLAYAHIYCRHCGRPGMSC